MSLPSAFICISAANKVPLPTGRVSKRASPGLAPSSLTGFETKPVTEDGIWHFSVTYRGSRGKVGPDYKGYVVGLRGKTDFGEMWIQKSASQAVFERFLK